MASETKDFFTLSKYLQTISIAVGRGFDDLHKIIDKLTLIIPLCVVAEHFFLDRRNNIKHTIDKYITIPLKRKQISSWYTKRHLYVFIVLIINVKYCLWTIFGFHLHLYPLVKAL